MDYIKISKVDYVKKLDKFSLSSSKTGSFGTGLLGTLFLTPTHLIFVDIDGKKDTWILHSLISEIEKLSTSTSGTPLHIRCKNFRSVTFLIPKECDAHDIYSSLIQISQPSSINELYCFQFSGKIENVADDFAKGWDKFSLLREYQRLGLPNSKWIISDINSNYEICDTYPKHLVVPATASQHVLLESSKFRSKGRLPVLTYLHSNDAAICRCAQPLSGFSNRSFEDRKLFKAISSTNKKYDYLYIVDTRPMINALANKAAGKGYEDENFYDNVKFHFYAIENVHVMRSSLHKLVEACELKVLSVNAFLVALVNSGWLKHIKSILDAALFIATSVNEGITVVVHCSDGWDRTAQTCSLASLFLDPYYRTIDGLEALIEKEWLYFGHMFATRCAHCLNDDNKGVAPIFTQFIDCVWQITQQFPFDFEFNEKFLHTLHDHVYSCQYGTFIGNCDKERESLKLKEKTYSLWAYIDNNLDEFINPLYYIKKSNNETTKTFLKWNSCPQSIKFWRAMYNRFDSGIHPRESIESVIDCSFMYINGLKDHINYLKQNIKYFKEQTDKNKNGTVNVNSPKLACFLSSSDKSLDEDSKKSVFDDSFDSLNSPLRRLEECMSRLQINQELIQAEYSNNENESKENFISYDMNKKPQLTRQDTLNSNESVNDLIKSIESVALDWQYFRTAKECRSCPLIFNETNQKYHCFSCGYIFCLRCIKQKVVLPGHQYVNFEESSESKHEISNSANEFLRKPKNNSKPCKVPVCIECFKNITSCQSFDLAN